MSKILSAKYYQEDKERISQKMKNKSLLSIEKIYRMRRNTLL